MTVININGKKPPVIYVVRIAQHWNGELEFFVEDLADDPRSRESVAWALRQMAEALEKSNLAEKCVKELEAQLAATRQPEAATTHRLVPTVPTKEMIHAGIGANDGEVRNIYRAMIAAAPASDRPSEDK